MADETIRTVLINLKLKLEEPNLRLPEEFSTAKKASEDFEKRAKESLKKVDESADKAAESVKKIADEEAKAAKAAEDAAKQIVGAQLKVLDSAKMAGEGAFTTARGFAFLFTSSDEGFQRMVENIAKVQGGFDLFKGSTDIIKGTVEGVQALKVATGAATVVEAVHAAAITATSRAANVATASFAAMWASMGPIGVAALAVGATLTALIASWTFWDDADEPVKDTKDALDDLIKSQERSLELQDQAVNRQLGASGVGRDVRRTRQSLNERIAQATGRDVTFASQVGFADEQEAFARNALTRTLTAQRLVPADLLREGRGAGIPVEETAQGLFNILGSKDRGIPSREKQLLAVALEDFREQQREAAEVRFGASAQELSAITRRRQQAQGVLESTEGGIAGTQERLRQAAPGSQLAQQLQQQLQEQQQRQQEVKATLEALAQQGERRVAETEILRDALVRATEREKKLEQYIRDIAQRVSDENRLQSDTTP